ncbi:MAG: ATP--guanido phosphotransferase [Candidatus Brocadiae bacterium]|nr:ATP--guanido phosphotransferase [Candidatus Brocadiia bacterium]
MEFYSLITQTPPIFLKGHGKDADVVMCSRLRLARNLEGFIFPGRSNQEENAKSLEFISQRLQSIQDFKDYQYIALKSLKENELYILFERHLISKEHLKSSMPRGIFFKKDEVISIMINEEDHLRIQIMNAGLRLKELWQEINKLDDLLEEHIPYCFHEKFGYLTACPSNVGTGLRASVMLHLPGLNFTNQMSKIQKELSKHHFVLRGLYGEGTVPLGDFFQLSNQRSLGLTEEQIVSKLEILVPQIIQYERDVREKMLLHNYQDIFAMFQKAQESLCDEKPLNLQDLMECLSRVRLGAALKVLPLAIETVNFLFLFSLSANLDRIFPSPVPDEEQDKFRARVCERFFKLKKK